MIVYKRWDKKSGGTGRVTHVCDGWFLFGLLPLYVRRIEQ